MWLQLRVSLVGPHAVPLHSGYLDIPLLLDCSPFLHNDQTAQVDGTQFTGLQQVTSTELPEQGCPSHSVSFSMDLCRIFLFFLHTDQDDHSSQTQSDGWQSGLDGHGLGSMRISSSAVSDL